MKQTFLIKHAVGGRSFIDSSKHDIKYEVSSQGEGWLFTIDVPHSDIVEEILALKDELNVFMFQEYEDKPTLKTWYYVENGSVRYDKEQGRLTIAASSCIEYYPHEYST
ncbi:hypothetical protein KP806_14130 [Paenibacillus sp. N4]|uniref:hypothetical protein n=1 Tax=Paenibacillus vietnamensis TaxID=2590547 RepID=UPI001CD13CB0|nr:hypothetical protein [Paenibacillus vietnamensis]MCA0756190.1 hypothetical protein [Paenibacillus vietnamensis]